MKIKIALIPPEHISTAEDLSTKLMAAMEAGEMSVIDKTTDALLSLTDKDYSPSLSEEYWHRLIKKVRSFDEDFKSEYLMTKPQLETIISAGVTESFTDIAIVVGQALKTGGVVLQLPFEEKSADV